MEADLIKKKKQKIKLIAYFLLYLILLFIFALFVRKLFYKYKKSKFLFKSHLLNDNNIKKSSRNNIPNIFYNLTLPNETFTEYKNNTINTYLNKEIIEKFNSFIKICHNNLLIDNKEYPLLIIKKYQ